MSAFIEHMKQKYPSINIDKALEIFMEQTNSIKVGTKEDPKIKIPIKSKLNQNVFIKCLDEYLK